MFITNVGVASHGVEAGDNATGEEYCRAGTKPHSLNFFSCAVVTINHYVRSQEI